MSKYGSSASVSGQSLASDSDEERMFDNSDEEDSPLGSLYVTDNMDFIQALEYNGEAPETIRCCVHDLVQMRAQEAPDAVAISAWDATLSYKELNDAADILAQHLARELSVCTNDLVHTCFEKSAWFFVAILAINKAGAAWVPLDPSHPTQRHQQIVQQTKATLAVTSPNNSKKCAGLVNRVVEVTPELMQELATLPRNSLLPVTSEVTPDHAAYILFTSGSTGTPKGLVMRHVSACTSQTAIAERLRMTADTRILQFASFVFDLCIGEIICPLISGATVCTPSDEMRMDIEALKGFIAERKVNWAFLTPAFTRTIMPEDVPSLELLLLAGEAVGRDVFESWVGKVRFVNGWGPAETCCFSTLQEWESKTESPLNIGRPVGGYCWIVDPEDHDRLVPIGSVGEIIIQGPTILREYLDDPVKTKQATVSSLPEWAPNSSDHYWNRFFKSGDLGYYNTDGTIQFVGRKDNQIKIRGLRVELGEVEHHLRSKLDGVRQIVVETFNGEAGVSLVAYFSSSPDTQMYTDEPSLKPEDIFIPYSEELKDRIVLAVGRLNVSLPNYMIPTLFIPCKHMPSITSTKLDRRTLRSLTARLSRSQLREYSLAGSAKRDPASTKEFQLQQIWSTILKLPQDQIGRDDSFLHIGGDSITAIQMVALARESGLLINAKHVFQDPRLLAVADHAIDVEVNSNLHLKPFGLLSDGDVDSLRDLLPTEHGSKLVLEIEDAYPCTSLQEGLMALAFSKPRSYIAKYVYELPSGVEIPRFKKAWEQTLNLCSNLRTRINIVKTNTLQYVIQEEASWEQTEEHTLKSFMEATARLEMTHGSRLCRYALIKEKSAGRFYFVLILHHAIFDGWSLNIILNMLSRVYYSEEIPSLQPFSGFINYTTQIDSDAIRSYWTKQLDGSRRSEFPRATSLSTKLQGSDKTFKTTIPYHRPSKDAVTTATVIRAAWSLILSRYCDTDDVCFGATISGRQASVSGIDRMAGPTVATVPVRVRLDRQKNVTSFLRQLQEQAFEMVPFEQYGPQNISRLNSIAKEVCDFSSLLVIQPVQHTAGENDSMQKLLTVAEPNSYDGDEAMDGYFTYPLVIQAFTFEKSIGFTFIYKPDFISDSQLQALSHHFETVIEQLLTKEDLALSQVNLAGAWDLSQCVKWNTADASPVHDCVHHIISEKARRAPTQQAIYTSDRVISYEELEGLSSLLAGHLVQLGVQAETAVPVCVERSIWTVVSMLAVFKAGGVFVPIESSLPLNRKLAIIESSNARHMIVSPSTESQYRGITEHTVQVSELFIQQLASTMKLKAQKLPRVNPWDAAYIIFTSGSTGTPKSIIVDHSALTTSMLGEGRVYHMNSSSRVLQFASCAFDVSLSEIIETLAFGGTVCIPTESQRLQSVAEFMRESSVNTALLTSSFLRTLKHTDVPSLKLLLLVGEAPAKDILETWLGHVRLVNAYGPSEISVFCTTHEFTSPDESPTTIGRGFGASCWIVEPNDCHQLAPIGCIGELVVYRQSARGYLNDKAKTEMAFLKTINWAPQTEASDTRQYFRTGDLARYNFDGTIDYLGRRDTQIKLRGHRIELGEIEYHIKHTLAGVEHVAVVPWRQDSRESLVAIFNYKHHKRETSIDETASSWLLSPDESFKNTFMSMIDNLQSLLPQYMIPSLFIPLQAMPLSNSLKLDRQKLSQILEGLSTSDLLPYMLDQQEKIEPTTEVEYMLRDIWAQILGMQPPEIGKHDSFLSIGGDSITAIHLVSLAASRGIKISVSDIFENPRLDNLAARAGSSSSSLLQPIEPFSILQDGEFEMIERTIKNDFQIASPVEDAYPCTSLQQGLLALTSRQAGSYVARYVYMLHEQIDTSRFIDAWSQTVKVCSNLRTRIFFQIKPPVQVVFDEQPAWDDTEDKTLELYLKTSKDISFDYGTRMVRYALVEESPKERYFVLIMHHAIFDGWTLNIMLNTLQKAYDGQTQQLFPSYSSFVHSIYQIDHNDARSYWAQQLDGAQPASFPQTRQGTDAPSKVMTKSIQLKHTGDTSITRATILRAAWGVALARYCNTTDICFGATLSGRHASVPGIDRIAGPTIATVPVRVQINSKQSIFDFLQRVQKQASEMVQYEQFGLQNIAKISSEIKEACDFSSLLVIQPLQHLETVGSTSQPVLKAAPRDVFDTDASVDGYFTYPLVAQFFTSDTHVELSFSYNPTIVSEHRLEALAYHLCQAVAELSATAQDSRSLGSISLLSDWDIQKALMYNSNETETIKACVHELIEAQARIQPDAIAISAWDSTLTYSELNIAAGRLALYLASSAEGAVKQGDFVHTCFEKSAWFFVAMLAINKLGAAWVPLDPSHPIQRQKQVISQTKATVALCSPANASLCSELFSNVVVVTSELDATLSKLEESHASHKSLPDVSPNDVAYILFTSGSTGVPKGIVMQHKAVCTSQTSIAGRLGLTPSVRILQFASFVFDLCIGEIIGPLISGACICVPSDTDRMNNLVSFINTQQINWAYLTPSFARTLSPNDIPGLELLLLAGEAPGQDILDTWVGNVRLVNGWGPAETCVFSTLHEWTSTTESPLTVGRPVGGSCWIVEPNCPEILAPIGCLGEVIIQGQTILREYLADPNKSRAAIIDTPIRDLPTYGIGTNRYFRSGDLAFYNADGTIQFAARKDDQIKIRGLRVELADVEHHLRGVMKGAKEIIVDTYRADTGLALICYFTLSGGPLGSNITEIFLAITPELRSQILSWISQLNIMLPSYMVPTIFIPCRFLPASTSTKVDRAVLRDETMDLGKLEIAEYSLVNSEKQKPATVMERTMQGIWAAILSRDPSDIGRDDSFLHLGGDSITAIQVVVAARAAGVIITVKAIFEDPRLSAISAKATEAKVNSSAMIAPFSLLPSAEFDGVTSDFINQSQLSNATVIADAYPCTSLQEGLMALAVKQPGTYIARYVYALPSSVDLAKFKAAWEQTLVQCVNLRTRIIMREAAYQAVINDAPVWEDTESYDLHSFMNLMSSIQMHYGSKLCRYALVNEGEKNFFVLVIHHAIYDGWSLSIMLDTLERYYNNEEVPSLQPFTNFVSHVVNLDRKAAMEYWCVQLEGAQRTVYPHRSTHHNDSSLSKSRIVKKVVPLKQPADPSITKATILRTGWALLLARYTNSDDVCFGTTVSGRYAPVERIDRIVGPAITTVPIRVRMSKKQLALELLQQVQAQASDMAQFEQFGLSNICNLTPEANEACDFTSLLVIQPVQHAHSGNDNSDLLLRAATPEEYKDEDAAQGYFTYPLVLQVFMHEQNVELVVTYDSTVVDEEDITRLYHHFEHIIHQLSQVSNSVDVASLSLASHWDLEQAVKYNMPEPDIYMDCVHHLIEAQGRTRPSAPAISGWDKTFTYSELNNASNRLAWHLVSEFHVKTGDLVHLCFEKSAWFFVAMLAVNKAGAAWVPLDPSHPVQRQRQVTQQTRATVALASQDHAATCRPLVKEVIVVTTLLDESLSAKFGNACNPPESSVTPSDAAYVLFTSGSTGTPKGLVMPHGAVASSQRAIAERLGLSEDVRMLQFASFMFDLCIGEIIGPLIMGACICVPSENERLNDLAGFVATQNISWMYLTPAFARTLRPEDFPTVELVLLAGEAVGRDLLDIWFGKVRLINGWGPAETCVFSTLHEWRSVEESPLTIGTPVGSFCWVVDQENSQQLAAIGCLGEVVIQGPTILKEYLDDPIRTKAAVVQNLPGWAPQHKSRWYNRFFKSGDLCSYNADGTLQFGSRKDDQVKVRGLRIELGEVEHHLRASFGNLEQVVADVSTSDIGNSILVAYLSYADQVQEKAGLADNIFIPLTKDLRARVVAALGQLRVSLPQYMVPSMFIPCHYIPSISSTKLDRRRLREMARELTTDQRTEYMLADLEKRAPTTSLESKLQTIWANILKIPNDQIGRDDSFLHLGGNSISIIQMTVAAREAGLTLTVKDVFDDPRLLAVASRTKEEDSTSASDTKPFSLISIAERNNLENLVREKCNLVAPQDVEDIYPCSSFQEGLMALAVKQPGSYMAKYVYALADNVNASQFKNAWDRTVSQCLNLRTRIVSTPHGAMQAVIKNGTPLVETHIQLREFMRSMNNLNMTFGSQLCVYGLIHERGRRYFVMLLHHSIFDGWSLNIVFNTLNRIYYGIGSTKLESYSGFIEYVMNIDRNNSKAYWNHELAGARRASFPEINRSISSSINDTQSLSRVVNFSQPTNKSVTTATILRAAWALVLAHYSRTDDICFGATVSGRQAPVPGLHEMSGPAITTVPVRVRIDSQQSVQSYLASIQAQASGMIPYEQFGLHNISMLGDEAKEACDFSSLLVIQPVSYLESDTSHDQVLVAVDPEEYDMDAVPEGYFSYPLVALCYLLEDKVSIHFTYQSTSVTSHQLDALAQHLGQAFDQLNSNQNLPLGALSIVGAWDIEKAFTINGLGPEVVSSCLHELVEAQTKRNPRAIAIKAWDGQLTYEALNHAANRLAHALVDDFKVKPEDLIPVCFEKSVWYPVTILAVNKAGAAWVPLDPSHPKQRLKQIVQTTGSNLMIGSANSSALCRDLMSNVIEYSSNYDEKLKTLRKSDSSAPKVRITPANAAYVLFTSGSTGTPKGVVMEHGSVCTSQWSIVNRLRLTPSVKLLQFSAHVFDVSVGEIFGPLISGASVVIPSEASRLNNLEGFIRDMGVTWAFLTPSFARTMKPENIPGLELLLLAGEAVTQDVFSTWFGKVRLVNGWGPAETCVFSSIHEWASIAESPLTIGRPVGCLAWIVDPNDQTKLAPIGCVGEILIQGPTLLREYLGEPEKTRATILSPGPDWAPTQNWNRFYRTGDLGIFDPDTIRFIGRKDNQIKIRGFRVELGEVEHHVRAVLPDAKQVAICALRRDTTTALVGYFSLNEANGSVNNTSGDLFLPLTTELRHLIAAAVGKLKTILPTYMVPTMFIPCSRLPFITSGKLDRGTLIQRTGELQSSDLAAYSLALSEKRPPETQMEIEMQNMWSDILKLPNDKIGRDDSFVGLGGDSISAIMLITLARERDIEFSVADIFSDPRLSAVSSAANRVLGDQQSTFSPLTSWALLPSPARSDVLKEAGEQLQLDSNSIQDGFPCTPTQEGLIALAETQPGSYTARFVLKLRPDIDMTRFKTAMASVVASCPNLRTRIFLSSHGPVQIILNEEFGYGDIEASAFSAELERPVNNMGYGTPLSQYKIAHDGIQFHLIWEIHHSVYDGWSFAYMLNMLYQSYLDPCHAQNAPIVHFNTYVQYCLSLEATTTKEFWLSQLEGANTAQFPPATTNRLGAATSSTTESTIRLDGSRQTRFTTSTLLRGSWALVLSRYLEATDVVFGCTMSGRNASVRGIENILGPTISTVPVHVSIDPQVTTGEFLANIQQQANSMIPFESTGLQNIAKLGDSAREACQFQNLLVIQPRTQSAVGSDADELLFELSDKTGSAQRFDTFPLVLQCILEGPDIITIEATYDHRFFEGEQVQRICDHLGHVVEQLATPKLDTPVSQVSLLGEKDIAQIYEWNRNPLPERIDSCVQDLISAQAAINPEHEALFSSDEGCLSYFELDSLTTKLAKHLSRMGMVPGSLVPICFEKSIWAIIAMLGIMKAGGAYVPLDPNHPLSRRQALAEELDAQFIIVSPTTAESCSGIPGKVVTLSSAFLGGITDAENWDLPKSDPEAVAYVIFTSGSTGKPKGVVMNQSALCSSIKGHGTAYGLGPTSRVLQFSSFVFDGCLSEILTPLAFGGTVCVPSETERLQDVTSFIKRAHVNVAMLTPSFARTISPDEVPTLETMLMGGEALSKDNIETWYGRVKLINAYGPTEVCVDCCSHVYGSPDESPTKIGRRQNATCWIVEVDDYESLVPIGCVGELLVHGPTLAQGYFGNKEITQQVFIDGTTWLPPDLASISTRLYKTGDLARYNPDGTIEYLGRKDTQVKLRGQRIELGEIEYHIKTSTPEVEHVVVDVVNTDAAQLLVAFMSFQNSDGLKEVTSQSSLSSSLLHLDETISEILNKLTEHLKASLPSYMVPSHFLPIKKMPFVSSMKMDRKSLRQQAAALPAEELRVYQTSQRKQFHSPSNDLELSLRAIWSRVLGVPQESIGVEDNFYYLGGDSIRLVTLSKLIHREHQVALGVSQLNSKDWTIRGLARFIDRTRNNSLAEELEGVDLQSKLTASLDEAWLRTCQYLVRQPVKTLDHNSTVFLTGASGYLGSEILRQLLKSPTVEKVVALVRAASKDRGLERVKRTAQIAGWWDTADIEKLEIWVGDISMQRLGLGETEWEKLCGVSTSGTNIDIIIHNAAVVNWNADYDKLCAANVDSTRLLIQVAGASPMNPKFIYISGGIGTETDTDHKAVGKALAKASGYIQTKYLSEWIVHETAMQLPGHQNRVSTVKPGLIIGNVDEGVANTDDFLWRIVATAAHIRAFPLEAADDWLQIADVHNVAESIIQQAFTEGGVETFVNCTSCMTIASFWDAVNSTLEFPCAPVPWEDWVSLALANMEEIGDEHPLWPVQQFLGKLSAPRRFPEPKVEMLERLQQAVRSNTRYLQTVGFISQVHGRANLGSGHAIKRSTLV